MRYDSLVSRYEDTERKRDTVVEQLIRTRHGGQYQQKQMASTPQIQWLSPRLED